MSDIIEVEHRRVGPIRVPKEEVLHLDPLPGFPNARRFVLISDAEGSPHAWLVCLDDLELSFRVTDPRIFFPDYDPFSAHKLPTSLASAAREDLVLLAIANVSDDQPRLNLAAPLVVNARTRAGRQVILDDESYGIGEPLREQEAPSSSAPVASAMSAPTQIESNPQR